MRCRGAGSSQKIPYIEVGVNGLGALEQSRTRQTKLRTDGKKSGSKKEEREEFS